MRDIDSFFEMLKEVCDELPGEFFHSKRGDDLVIMGEYHRSHLGNKITIYYGSFARTCGWMSDEQLKDRLREVVRHEFRHHMENLAGMYGRDSLEREDRDELRRYLRGNA